MKTIIIYSTKYGSVEKAAKMLKSELKGEVILVNIMKEKVPSIDEYDNVILGGSMYYFRIQGKLKSYMVKNLSSILKKRIGLFICAGATPNSEDGKKEITASFPPELYNHAICKDLLGYEYNFSKMNFFERMIFAKIGNGDKSNKSEFYQKRIENFTREMSN